MIMMFMVLGTACGRSSTEHNDNPDNAKELIDTYQVKVESMTEEEGEKEMLTKLEDGLEIIHSNGVAILADLFVDEGKIIFGDIDGTIKAIHMGDGNVVWEQQLDSRLASGFISYNKQIITTSGDALYFLNRVTGEITSHYKPDTDKLPRRMDKWDYHESAPNLLGDIVYYGTSFGQVHAVSAIDGRLLQIYDPKVATDSAPIRSKPLIMGDYLIFGDFFGRVFCMSIDSAEVIWTYKAEDAIVADIISYGNTIIFSGRDTFVRALDIDTGDLVWQFRDLLGSSWITGDPYIYSGKLIIATSDSKNVYIIHPETGDLEFTYKTKENVFTGPIVYNDQLIIADGSAYAQSIGTINIYQLDGDRENLHQYQVKSNVFSQPVLVEDHLYFATRDGNLYQLDMTK